jgi:hypothetical protein
MTPLGFITALDLACYRLGKQPGSSITMEECEQHAKIPFFGGCARCAASIACYNAYPTRFGYWLCDDCIAPGEGWSDVHEANRDIFIEPRRLQEAP